MIIKCFINKGLEMPEIFMNYKFNFYVVISYMFMVCWIYAASGWHSELVSLVQIFLVDVPPSSLEPLSWVVPHYLGPNISGQPPSLMPSRQSYSFLWSKSNNRWYVGRLKALGLIVNTARLYQWALGHTKLMSWSRFNSLL